MMLISRRGRLGSHDAVEKREEGIAVVTLGAHALHVAGVEFERSVQGQRAVSHAFEAMPFGPARRQRQQRGKRAVQRLDRRLHIHA